MKGSDFKPREKTIELLDGPHKIAMDFNAFEALEAIYGDMQTAFNAFSSKDAEGKLSAKFADVKNFLCAGINACIEDPADHFSPYDIGKRLVISRMTEYMNALMPLLNNSMPDVKKVDDEDELEKN